MTSQPAVAMVGAGNGGGNRGSCGAHNNQPTNGSDMAAETVLTAATAATAAMAATATTAAAQTAAVKIKNRESEGTLSFDGFRWMAGRNNQPKVGLSNGI